MRHTLLVNCTWFPCWAKVSTFHLLRLSEWNSRKAGYGCLGHWLRIPRELLILLSSLRLVSESNFHGKPCLSSQKAFLFVSWLQLLRKLSAWKTRFSYSEGWSRLLGKQYLVLGAWLLLLRDWSASKAWLFFPESWLWLYRSCLLGKLVLVNIRERPTSEVDVGFLWSGILRKPTSASQTTV